jgi:hypothetical protein
MNISEQEFKFMTESITSDLIQLLMDREHYSLPRAVDAVYNSNIYSALMRPASGLYSQSSGYVYNYLDQELKKHIIPVL